MHPGRFLTLCLLYFGVLATVQAVVAYALEGGSGATWAFVGLLVGLGGAIVGVRRLRHPKQEAQPERYGPWLYLIALFLVGYTAWLAYAVWLSIATSAGG